MKNIRKIGVILMTLAVGLTWYSCTKDKELKEAPENNSQEQTLGTTLERIDLGSDGYVDFVEVEPGVMYVDMTVSSIDLMPKEQGLNPLEVYEFFKHQKAPEVIVKAYNRANKKVVQNDNIEKETSLAPGADTKSRLTAAQFQSKYCGGGWDYKYCWLNRTNTSYVRRDVFSMHTTVNPYRGTVRHRVRVKKWGSWSTLRDKTVLQGYISTISAYAAILDDYFEAKVFEASGDGYHHSIRGID